MENLKYKIRYDLKHSDLNLYRIEALKDFGDVKKGSIGGWIQSEHNLAQEGLCWIYDEARVYDKTRVFGNARIYGNARIFDNAWIFGNAQVFDTVWISGIARVFDNAQVSGKAKIFDTVWISGNAKVGDNVFVFDNAWIYGNAQVLDDSIICDDALVYGQAILTKKTKVDGKSVLKDSRVYQIWFEYKCPYCGADNEYQAYVPSSIETECVKCNRSFNLTCEAKVEIDTFADELVDLAKAFDEEIKELERLGK